MYYRDKGETPRIDQEFLKRLEELIVRHPAYGYRRLSEALGCNHKKVQRVLQMKGWQATNRCGETKTVLTAHPHSEDGTCATVDLSPETDGRELNEGEFDEHAGESLN